MIFMISDYFFSHVLKVADATCCLSGQFRSLETFSDPSESRLKKIVDSMATNCRNRFLKF